MSPLASGINIGAEIIVATEDRAAEWPFQCRPQSGLRQRGAIIENTAVDPSTLVVRCCKASPLIRWSNDCKFGFEV